METVAAILSRMSGRRSRCMYCGDSRGTDIDHHWPKSRYPDRTFSWPNLLWTCAGCNRKKGSQFGLSSAGAPLLLDPTTVDPWDHLFYSWETGWIVARFQSDGRPDPIGEYTTNPQVLPLNIQAIIVGRQSLVRQLRRSVSSFLRREMNLPELLEAIRDCDAYGLPAWFFEREGRFESPFSELFNDDFAWNAVINDLANWDAE